MFYNDTLLKGVFDGIKSAVDSIDSMIADVRELLDVLNGDDVIIMESTVEKQKKYEDILRKVNEHFK